MAFTVTINAVDRSNRVGYRSLQITKDGAMESAVMRILTPDGYRPSEGDAVRITRTGGHLETGGEITRIVASRLNGGAGGKYVTGITVRGWWFEAEEVIVWASFPAQGLYVTAEALRALYLDAKGWTNLAPTTGGPSLPALTYAKKSLRAIFDDLTKRSGHPWRVNGDRQFAFVEPGSLTSPVTIGNGNTLLGVQWERDRTRRATRLFVTMGGSGVVLHSETHTASGTQTFWPVNVLPNEQAGSLKVGAAAAATSITVKGLRPSSTLTTADTFTVAGGATTYTVAADVTTDGNGDATVTCSPGLAAAAVEGDAVVFDAGTFVRLQVNGVDTSLTAGVYAFDHIQGGISKTGSAPTAGTLITYIAPITSPATLRVWDASTRHADGTWDYAVVRDAEIQASDRTHFETTKPWADIELASRLSAPKKLKVITTEQGLYPWLRQPVDIPGLDVSGDYLINRTVTRDVGAQSTIPRTELELIEGDTIGRDWTSWWRERPGSTTGGSVTVGVGGGGTGTGGGTATPGPFVGYGIPLGGANVQTVPLSTSWTDVGEANPMPHPADATGTWTLRVYAYLLADGTLQVRLLVGGVEVASVSTTTTGGYVDVTHFGSPLTDTYTGPAALGQCLLQAKVLSGTNTGVFGQAHTVKTA